MRIVVTGGCGFIGKHLVRKLKREGHNVYILDYRLKESTNLAGYIETKRFFEEVTDHKTKKIDVVYDLATMPLNLSLKEPYTVAYRIYCMATVLCELAREEYFDTLVHVSSSEVYNISTPYAAAKKAQDLLITSYVNSFGIKAYIACPFNTYGPGQDLGAIIPATIKRILKKKRPIIYGDGNQSRDLVYVSDTVNGIIQVYNDRQSMDITGGRCYSVKEIVSKISELMNYKGKPIYLLARTADTFEIHSGQTIDNPISLEEGLKKTIKWWKKQSFTL